MRLPFGGNPLEFGDEIWRQKTRVLGLPDGEEIMTLAFFVLTQYRHVTDRRTDTLRSLLPALAQRRAGKNTYLPEWPHLWHNVTSKKLYDIDSSLPVNIKHSELG